MKYILFILLMLLVVLLSWPLMKIRSWFFHEALSTLPKWATVVLVVLSIAVLILLLIL